MTIYLDSSALVKLFLSESGSAETREILQQDTRPWYSSRVTYAEILSALARSFREGRMDSLEYRFQKGVFFEDWRGLAVVELTPKVLVFAERIIEQHGLRGFDAIHLCSALWVGNPEFACFDHRLRAAARAEGLAVVP